MNLIITANNAYQKSVQKEWKNERVAEKTSEKLANKEELNSGKNKNQMIDTVEITATPIQIQKAEETQTAISTIHKVDATLSNLQVSTGRLNELANQHINQSSITDIHEGIKQQVSDIVDDMKNLIQSFLNQSKGQGQVVSSTMLQENVGNKPNVSSNLFGKIESLFIPHDSVKGLFGSKTPSIEQVKKETVLAEKDVTKQNLETTKNIVKTVVENTNNNNHSTVKETGSISGNTSDHNYSTIKEAHSIIGSTIEKVGEFVDTAKKSVKDVLIPDFIDKHLLKPIVDARKDLSVLMSQFERSTKTQKAELYNPTKEIGKKLVQRELHQQVFNTNGTFYNRYDQMKAQRSAILNSFKEKDKGQVIDSLFSSQQNSTIKAYSKPKSYSKPQLVGTKLNQIV
jgi:hypothetical protein